MKADAAVLAFCFGAACFLAGVEASAALKPARTVYLLTKQAASPAPKPAWYINNCDEVARTCRARVRMEKVKL